MITLRQVARVFGEAQGLRPITLDIADGEILSVVGLSGSGKSTLLRCLSGLDRQYSGTIEIQGMPARRYWAERRAAMVSQKYANLHWMTVERNLAIARTPSAMAIDDVLRLVGLTPWRSAYPSQLSGGMQQRLALARAILQNAQIVLLDEPFGALDVANRIYLQDFVKSHFTTRGVTVVFVTHDPIEALYLGDRVLLLSSEPDREHTIFDLGRDRFQSQADKSLPDFLALNDQILNGLVGQFSHRRMSVVG